MTQNLTSTLVDELSAEEFKKLLALIVGCERIANGGRLKTKTTIELGNYLKVLNHEMSLQDFKAQHTSPFTVAALHELKISAIVACCYIRVFTEVGQI